MKRFVLLVALLVTLPVLATGPALNAPSADLTASEPEITPGQTETTDEPANASVAITCML